MNQFLQNILLNNNRLKELSEPTGQNNPTYDVGFKLELDGFEFSQGSGLQ